MKPTPLKKAILDKANIETKNGKVKKNFTIYNKRTMSSLRNIGKNLDKQFENHNYLPQKLELEDYGFSIKEFIENQNFSVVVENGTMKKIPIIYVQQEKWAERKVNWSSMRTELGEEMTRPFIAISRTSVKRGTAPLKYSIPRKRKFTFVKVPIFDGTLKGYNLYKIPQPVYVDMEYEIRFVTHYMEDVDDFYEMMMEQAYSDAQGYLKVNGYDIASKIGDPSEENAVDDISSERIFQIVFPVTILGKIVDPTKFEKVNTITKISIKISEK